MPACRFDTIFHSEYRRLAFARPAGPVIGIFKGQSVSSAVIDKSGRRYVYSGVISRDCHGRHEGELLGPGEWIIEPGIVYREDNLSASSGLCITGFRAQLPEKPLLKIWAGLVERLRQLGKGIEQKPGMSLDAFMSKSDRRFLVGFWACVAFSTWLIFLLGLW
jgi:hypothetical protein